MAKLVLMALLAVASLAQPKGDAAMTDPVLTFNPNPMTAGKKATLTGPPGAVVLLDWDPAGSGPEQVTLNDKGEYRFTCPGGFGDVIATSPGCTPAGASWGP